MEKAVRGSCGRTRQSVHVEGGATLPLPAARGRSATATLGRNAILGADLNYDFKTDLVFATARRSQNLSAGHPAALHGRNSRRPNCRRRSCNGSYTGAWAIDFDLDGDLDIVLGVPQGEPIVLRNNGDGTFAPGPAVQGRRWDDLPSPTPTSMAMACPTSRSLTATENCLSSRNERLGVFKQRSVPPQLTGPQSGGGRGRCEWQTD